MDSDTWNAYHIVSNRARSVCYATRQQHFRKRAELTVNALISTAASQLDAMKDLKVCYKDLSFLCSSSSYCVQSCHLYYKERSLGFFHLILKSHIMGHSGLHSQNERTTKKLGLRSFLRKTCNLLIWM